MTVEVQSDLAVAAQLFRGMGDPTRLVILTELLAGERRVVDLVAAVGGSQSNVSGHLACLKECGRVLDRPEGRAAHYRLASAAVVDMLRQADALRGGDGETGPGRRAGLTERAPVLPRPGGRAVHYRLASPAVVDMLRQAEVLLGGIGENAALCRTRRMPLCARQPPRTSNGPPGPTGSSPRC